MRGWIWLIMHIWSDMRWINIVVCMWVQLWSSAAAVCDCVLSPVTAHYGGLADGADGEEEPWSCWTPAAADPTAVMENVFRGLSAAAFLNTWTQFSHGECRDERAWDTTLWAAADLLLHPQMTDSSSAGNSTTFYSAWWRRWRLWVKSFWMSCRMFSLH